MKYIKTYIMNNYESLSISLINYINLICFNLVIYYTRVLREKCFHKNSYLRSTINKEMLFSLVINVIVRNDTYLAKRVNSLKVLWFFGRSWRIFSPYVC